MRERERRRKRGRVRDKDTERRGAARQGGRERENV